ncbi:MAG: Gfo/Idh/MocA family oxidoreductase [Elusimicrobia bacterium]|nr:Gfo/Idh/MocA family oxidoreductase [Elusimicrobiota bacterium]
MNKVKIALAGLGKIGLLHLSILKNIKNAEVVALMDKETGAAKRQIEGLGLDIPVFDSVERMIEETQPDGLVACVPPAVNKAMAQACLAKGISLFIEKPMAGSLQDALAMTGLVPSQDAPAHAVGYMVAHYPLVQKAQELLKQNHLGQIRHYRASLYLAEVFERHEGWRQNPAISGGGAVAIVGSHLLYLVQSFFGLPHEVRARAIRLFAQVEDIACATLEHENFFGDLHVSWSRPGYRDMGFNISVEGTEGFLELNEASLAVFRYQDHQKDGWQVYYPWDITTNAPDHLEPGQMGYWAQDNDFIQAISERRPAKVTWEDGLKTQKLIEAIYRSSRIQGRGFALAELG